MKRILTMLFLFVQVLVGTVAVPDIAVSQPTLTVSPTRIQFPVTPLGSSSMMQYQFTAGVLGTPRENIWIVTVSVPTGYEVTFDDASNPNRQWYSSIKYWDSGAYAATKTVYVRYTPPAMTADSVITNVLSGYNFTITNDTANVLLTPGPLPIQLASFKAAPLDSKNVILNWTTLSETNNYGFEVQRNGAKIAFIQGHGTTLQQHTYSYTDNPSPGKYEYRLKQVDLDGTATLSENVVIDVTAPMKFTLNQNYPNPFNPSTQIAFSVTKEGTVSLRVYDILGREVATLVNENRKPGQYIEQFNGSRMASGMYIYVLRSSEGQLTGRMMMLK